VSHDPATLAFYAREAAAYAARDRRPENPELTAFLDRLAPGSHVLDLGCGGGQDALSIKNAGFAVAALDGSPELAAEAQKRLSLPVRALLFEDLADVEIFDAVWANASLLHVPKPALADTFARIRRALKPGGLFYASFKSGGAEGRDALGRYYNHPSKDDLAAALPAPAWTIRDINESEGSGYDGVATSWLAVTAKRN
jgi:SAM-dependent methyltransferase